MSNMIELASFQLKPEVSAADFSVASDCFQQDFVALQNGYLSRKLLRNDKTFVDFVIWETPEDAEQAAKAMATSQAAGMYMANIEETSCNFQHFVVERNY